MHVSFFWSAFMRAPMLRLALPFICGIALAIVYPVGLVPIGITFGILTVFAGGVLRWSVSYENRHWRGFVFASWIFLFGVFWNTLRDPSSSPDHIAHVEDRSGRWSMRIIAVNGVSEKLLRADAEILAHGGKEQWDRCSGSVMLSLLRGKDSAMVEVGDRLIVEGDIIPIERIPDPGGFDRKAWAASRGMNDELFAPRRDWSVTAHNPQWTDPFRNMREHVSQWVDESGMPLHERALVKALVLGLRDELTTDQRTAFVRSGTIHVLAVSGTHVGFIYGMLFLLFRAFGNTRGPRILRGVLILIALWGYAGLTGAAPSVLRATIMFSLFTFADMFAQRNDSLNSLFTAAFVLLMWDPHMLVEVGFQLSFLAVLGIILFMRPIQDLWVPDNWLMSKVWSLCAISLAAQAFTTPLSVYLFNGFPVWFIPANLIVVTAAGLAVYGSVLLLLLYKVPIIGAAITWAMTMLLRGVGLTTEFFAGLPWAYPPVRIDSFEMMMFYGMVTAFMAAWTMHWRPGAIIGMAFTTLLLVSIGSGILGSGTQRTFIVYDDRHALNAAMSVGNSLVVMSHDDVLGEDEWMKKKVERHLRELGCERPELIDNAVIRRNSVSLVGRSILGGDRWRAGELDILFYADGVRMDTLGRAKKYDAIVIHDLECIGDKDLERMADQADRLVLAGELPWKTRSYVTRWSVEHHVILHDVREQGAFILTQP